LIYAFGGLDKENGLRPYDKYQDIEQGKCYQLCVIFVFIDPIGFQQVVTPNSTD